MNAIVSYRDSTSIAETACDVLDKLRENVSVAIAKNDAKRLKRFDVALNRGLAISHYSALHKVDIAAACKVVTAALALLAPKPRKRRIQKAPTLLSVDVPLADELPLANADLFTNLERWPRRPYCTNDKQKGLRIRPLQQALRMSHIQCNRPGLHTWVTFDIDRLDAQNAWRGAGLAEPTWTAINEQNGHAHLSYGLRVPVRVAGMGAKTAPIRYLASIEAMMRDKLGADHGYAGLITKNPAHTDWRVLRGPCMTFDLSDLAANLPGIQQYIPKRKAVDAAGVGRNVNLFETLRDWAYKAIRPFWGQRAEAWNGWLSLCNSRALVCNGEFPCPLDGKEVWQVARSIARWTWTHTTEQGFSDWQSAQGRKGGLASGVTRAAASEDKAASARLMRAAGMTYAAIAKELGVHVNSVANWLR